MDDSEKPKHIRCRCIIELLGKPKEHIEKTIRDYVEKIKTDSNYIVLSETFSDPREQDKLWSIFTEIEFVAKGIPQLTTFCLDYMPSSIEILKPEEIIFKNSDISLFLNDMQGKLHNVDMVAKELRVENEFLRKNMKVSIKNSIAILLKIRSMEENELSKLTGIPEEELKLILKELIKDGKIVNEDERFRLK